MIKPSRGEVWYADLDPTKGHEQAKKRPCIVLSNDDFNYGPAGLFIIVPLTTRNRKNPLHITLVPPEGGIMVQSYALCEQIRTISHMRFKNHSIGRVSELTLQILEFTIKALLDFN